MKTISTVLIAVAKELAKQANDSLPELQKGETIQEERFENGIYYRKSYKNGTTCLCQYDFKNKKSRIDAVGGTIND